MISKALQFTGDVLDQFLKNLFSLDERKVVLNNLVDSNGTVPSLNQNKLVISLINIERETTKPYYVREQRVGETKFSDINPAERYNLDILISSHFDNYLESLKFLDATILFFQVNTRLNAASFSNLPEGLTKLEFDIEKMTYHQMQSLWTAMGAKYQPSVVYKMRSVLMQGDEIKGFIPAVTNISNRANL